MLTGVALVTVRRTMADVLYVASAAVTTVVVLAVFGLVVRMRVWGDYSPTEPPELSARLREAADAPAVWMLGFLLLLVVFGGGTVLFVSGVGAGALGVALAAAAATVFALALFAGVYSAARSRGRPASQGVAEGSFLVGLLVVLLIAAKLVV